jgi:hypothetical protein
VIGEAKQPTLGGKSQGKLRELTEFGQGLELGIAS